MAVGEMRRTIQTLCTTALSLSCAIASGDSNDLVGDWDIVATGFAFGGATSHIDLAVEPIDSGIVAFIYNGPVDVRVDGDRFEIDLDWSTLFATEHTSTLIGELTGDGELVGIVSHNDDLNFLGDPMRGGKFTGVRATPRRIQEEAPPEPVDLSGIWTRAFGRWKVRKNNYATTPRGQAVIDTYKDMDNPTTRCASPGLIMATDLPYPMEILPTNDYVLIVYGADYVRRIYLDGRDFPESATASSFGFSNGEWKGDTLVVKTTQLTPAFMSHSGQPVSADAYTIEHFYVDDKGYLHADLWLHDPVNYERPPYIPRVMDRDFSPNVITRIGCDPYSFFRQLYLEGKLGEFWDRAKYRR